MVADSENIEKRCDDRFVPANDDDDSTVNTDDEEFSDFISSQWKDSVEVGLAIDYPLPYTNYLADPSIKNKKDPIVGKSLVIDGESNSDQEENNTSRLPTLSLSTVLQEGSIAPLFDGTQWAGTRVWKAAVVGLEYILRQRPTQKLGALLELGCGLGVPGMIWKQVLNAEGGSSSPRVILTDRDSLVPQLQANVEDNFRGDSSIEAVALDWSTEGIASLLRTEKESHNTIFDVCINCDCVYEPLYGRKAWESLVDVLSEVALTSPSTLLVTALERRNADNVEGFLSALEATGRVETPIRRVVRHDEDPHHVIEIYVTKGKEHKA